MGLNWKANSCTRSYSHIAGWLRRCDSQLPLKDRSGDTHKGVLGREERNTGKMQSQQQTKVRAKPEQEPQHRLCQVMSSRVRVSLNGPVRSRHR